MVACRMCIAVDAEKDDNISSLLKEYGFKSYECHNFGQSAAHVIGHSPLYINGQYTTVLVVICRGTKTDAEKIGDWLKGGIDFFLDRYSVWDNAYDYEEEVWRHINKYISDTQLEKKGKIKVLVTGHSLGGAAANLVSARITDMARNKRNWCSDISVEYVYSYTFGSIKALEQVNNISDGFDNIHNIYNKYDSFGPDGNLGFLKVSSPYSKFGHTDFYFDDSLKWNEEGSSTNNNNLDNYMAAIKGDYIRCRNNYSEIDCYNDIIEKYIEAIKDHWDIDHLKQEGLNYMVIYFNGEYDDDYSNGLDQLGYYIEDINNDGVEDLLIGELSIDDDGFPTPIFQMYTVYNDEPILLVDAKERDLYYLVKDNTLYNEGSNSAISSGGFLYKIEGAGDDTHLQLIDGYYSDGDIMINDVHYYHTDKKAWDIISSWECTEEEFIDFMKDNFNNCCIIPYKSFGSY